MTALIHQLLQNPLSGPEIEAGSFAIIDQEVPGCNGFSPAAWEIVRRMIHTCADPSLAAAVKFSADAIASGTEALRRGAPVCRWLAYAAPMQAMGQSGLSVTWPTPM